MSWCGGLRLRHRGGWQRIGELALEFQQQALGGFFADARYLGQPAGFLHGHGVRQVGDRQAGENRQGGARTDSGNLQQLAKGKTFGLGAETKKDVGIFADGQMGQQAGLLSGRRQVVEGAHRHIDFVADAVHVEQDLRRVFLGQRAGEASDHRFASAMGFRFMRV